MTISSRSASGALFTARVTGRVIEVYRGVGDSAVKLRARALQHLTGSNRDAVDAVMSRAFDIAGVA